MAKTLKEKTAQGLFWGGLSNGIQQLIQAVVGFALLHFIAPEEYGLVALLMVFSVFALALQEAGFTAALVNKKRVTPRDYNAVFWFSTLMGGTLYALLYGCAPAIAHFYDEPALTPLARVLFLGFVFSALGTAQHAFAVRNLLVKERAKVDVSAVFISSLVGLFLAWKGYSYWAIALQNVLYFAVGLVVRWYYIPWRPTFQIDLSPLKSMLSFSSKLLATALFLRATEQIMAPILGKFYPKAQVGYYSQGRKYATMGGNLLNGMMVSVAQPILAQLVDQKERQRAAFRKLIRLGAFIAFPLMGGIALVAHEVMLLVGKEDLWLPAVPFLQLFCVWGAFNYLWVLYNNLITAHGKSNLSLYGTLFTGSLQLLSVVCLFPWGIFPMVIAYILSSFAGLFFWQYHAHRLMGLRLCEVVKDLLPFLAMAFLALALGWLAGAWSDNLLVRIVSKVVVTGGVYGAIAWFSKAVIVRESVEFFRSRLLKRGRGH